MADYTTHIAMNDFEDGQDAGNELADLLVGETANPQMLNWFRIADLAKARVDAYSVDAMDGFDNIIADRLGRVIANAEAFMDEYGN